jgi:hypothetical protein
MSEAIGIAVRRRRSHFEAERLVLEFERSGLRRQAFCAQHDLSVAALDKYCKRCRTLEHPPTQPQPKLNRKLPVELVNSAAPPRCSAVERCRELWVELANGRRIEVAHGFDASTLERLVAVLERA